MTNTALKVRYHREKRKNDPEIREKIEHVIDSCDEALGDASELLQAVVGVLAKYPIVEDVTYHCNVQEIQTISDALERVIDCRAKIDRERYIRRLAEGPLGADIERLGDDFTF